MIKNLDGSRYYYIKTRMNACRDMTDHDMMDNSTVVREFKENFRLSKATPRHFDSRCRGNKLLVNHSVKNVPEVIVV